MRTVYVITICTGEYSDRTEMPLVVVATNERAEELVTQLDEIARRHGVLDGCNPVKYENAGAFRDAVVSLVGGAPPDFAMSYTGFRFYADPAPAEETI